MLRTILLVSVVVGGVTTARADTSKDLTKKIEQWVTSGKERPEPRFAFTDTDIVVAPNKVQGSGGDADAAKTKKTTVATAADKTSTWIASDVQLTYKAPGTPAEWLHVTALFDGAKPVALHYSAPVTADQQKETMTRELDPQKVPKGIDAGAEELAKQFETSIATPKTLAATVSARKDVVLYGSEMAERFVGGAKVKSQLTKWNLAMKVRDGVQAGLTSSKTVGWVAAYVDATPVKNPKAKPVPYRVLFIYEQSGSAWQIVSAQFSFMR